jgi:hypothetical protein
MPGVWTDSAPPHLIELDRALLLAVIFVAWRAMAAASFAVLIPSANGKRHAAWSRSKNEK